MATGARLIKTGKQIVMNRVFNSAPTRTAPSAYALGINNGTPADGDTDLTKAIPINNATVNFKCNAAFIGSSGGDNSTNNTTTYKVGGGQTDATGQNLIGNSSNATKIWTRSTLDANFTATYYSGFWFYIKDAATLAKFKTSGTCLQAKWATDASNYYSKTWTVANLATGWNWLDSVVAINALTATGSPGTLSQFIVTVTTNNATDTFIAGDVVIDLVRTWQASDLVKTITSVTVDESALLATIRGDFGTTYATGFSLNGMMTKNDAGTGFTESTFNAKGKGESDEFVTLTKLWHA